MVTNDELKRIVKDKYSKIAIAANNSECCSTKDCCGSDNNNYTVFQDDYSNLTGYVADADLGLGCGMPTELADIEPGDTVVDLGSGAGNDVFISRAITGEKGKVIGIDMTDEMINKARKNNLKLGYKNVEFKLGEIENIPLEENVADVVVSNCVLNLVPDKARAFSEIYRILKHGAHFCVSDIVIKGKISDELKKSAELYAGCISGALDQDEYLNIIRKTGFKDIEIKKIKRVDLPDSLLRHYLNEQEIKINQNNLQGIFSITVVGFKGN